MRHFLWFYTHVFGWANPGYITNDKNQYTAICMFNATADVHSSCIHAIHMCLHLPTEVAMYRQIWVDK